jgi:protein arginine kinase activator
MGKTIKCHCCEKPATVHLTQIVENKVHKVDLCEECAQDKGVTNPEGFSMADFLPTFEDGSSSDGELVCESCGLTQKEFKKNGRLGCASCYDVFKPVLDSMLEGMHAGNRHAGRIPDGFEAPISEDPSVFEDPVEPMPRSPEEDIADLEKELTEAIEAEEYEQAAEIRDRIRQLKELAAEC